VCGLTLRGYTQTAKLAPLSRTTAVAGCVPVAFVLFNAVAQAKRQKRHAASHHGEAMIVTPGSLTKVAKAQIPNSRPPKGRTTTAKKSTTPSIGRRAFMNNDCAIHNLPAHASVEAIHVSGRPDAASEALSACFR